MVHGHYKRGFSCSVNVKLFSINYWVWLIGCGLIHRIRPTYIDSLMTLSSLLSRETGGVAGKQGVGGAPSRAEESWQLMERALQQESSNPDVLNNAGTVLLRLG